MKRMILLLAVLLIVSIRVDAQVASSLSIDHSPASGDPFTSNDGLIKAEIKPTTALGLGDYNNGINMWLSPNSNGIGYTFQLNFNWNGIYLRHGHTTSWTTWRKLLVHDIYGDVSIERNLDVAGFVRAQEVKVCLNQGCDYVFDDDYNLMDLNDLSSFIKTNKHLPEVAPAAEMEAEGINLSEMNALLLKKIEELTLYVIELKNEIEELKK